MWLRLAVSLMLFLTALPGAAQEARKDPFAGDARLDAQVRVQAEGIALGELLERVERVTGVQLSADPSAADDKAVVFGPARPLREVLADLAALFDYRWAREKGRDGRPRYLLRRDVRSRQREEELRRAVARRLAERMEEQLRALQESPEQLARRPERDLVRKLLENPETRLGTELYSELNPRQRELLFFRRRLNFPFKSLEARYQEPLRQGFSERLRFFEEWLATQPELSEKLRNAPRGNRSEFLVDQREDLERGSLRFRVRHAGGMVIVGMGVGILPFTVDVTTEEGRTQVTSGLGFWPVGMVDGRATWVLPPRGNPYTGEAPPEATRLPASEVTAAAAAQRHWIDGLRTLAERSGQPVLADFYRSRPLTRPGAEPEPAPTDPAVRALDDLCRPAGYLWWTRAGSLFFRKRDWFEQRRYEVPDRWLAATAEGLSSRRGLPFRSDALRAAELTAAQLSGLQSLFEGDFTQDEDALAGLAELLSLLKAAPIPDRALPEFTAARQPGRAADVTARTLTPRQRALLAGFLETRDHPVSPDDLVDFGASLAYFPETEEGRVPPDRVRVRLEWSLGTEVSRPFSISLPLRIPDDRRDRTHVEMR